jgi:HD-GYP domain-containing protein (c-di-GMP phosphodiesterase class II)
MRLHPVRGYEILKDISFPWPVASCVLQHHERLDGSGYPQGLVGDEIMWQVRLLAVADLLEARRRTAPTGPAWA